MTGKTPRPVVAGNWKMNGLAGSRPVMEEIARGYGEGLRAEVDLLVCPPATLIAGLAEIGRTAGIALGGQDCHDRAAGAHTGDLSAEMLADAGAGFVIVGHSERRTDHGESDAAVRAKAAAALRAQLTAVICVGETRSEREAGAAIPVVGAQIRGSLPAGATSSTIVIAYEPVWAIGTGLVPTPADVAAMHAAIRQTLSGILGAEGAGVRILYGGSVKPSNAAELMSVPDVDGALVGGASLVAADFLAIAAACRSKA